MLDKVIVVGAILMVYGVGRSWQFCPGLCECSNSELRVNCSVGRDENGEYWEGGEGGGGGLTGGRHGHGLGNYLNEIPIFLNPQIQVLVLHGNKIGDLTPYSLQYYNRLVELDLSSNRIVVLGNGSFETLKSLKVLNVSGNRVQVLGSGAFRGLESLLSLDASGNDIEAMDRETFKQLNSLQTLNLDRNRIIQLDLSLFSRQSNLESISATHNRIQKILQTSPDLGGKERGQGESPSGESKRGGLFQLRYLNLSYNELDQLPDEVLDFLVHLETLDLSHNAMQLLEQNSLSNNLHLRTINLSHNKIETFPLYLLSRCGQLRWLDLSHNHLRVLSSHYFHNLFKLEYLDISYNARLERIERNALVDNINLVYFYADHLLQLNDIPLQLLSNKPFLTLVSLQYASIQRLAISQSLNLDDPPSGPLLPPSPSQQQHEEAYFLSALQALHTLNLKGNPWECNCSALVLYNYITDASRSVSDVEILEEENSPNFFKNILCATPAQFSGIPLIKLNVDSFSECVGKRDSFTQTVLILGASILSLIVFIIIVKIMLATGTCANLLATKQGDSPVVTQNFHLHPTYPNHPPNPTPSPYPNQFHIIENYRRPPKFGMVDNPDEEDTIYSNRMNPRLDFTNQYTHQYDKQVPSVLV